MANTAWDRSLGTSKREQGILTPKAPQNRRKMFAFNTGRIPKKSIIRQVAFGSQPAKKLTWWQWLFKKLFRWRG